VNSSDLPPSNLGIGNAQTSLGRICITRHPLLRNASVSMGAKLPGAINMSYADGHAGRLPLQQIKNLDWCVGFAPIADPWRTTP
jgi:prepilin-type processing-associated H-X9-DG protein